MSRSTQRIGRIVQGIGLLTMLLSLAPALFAQTLRDDSSLPSLVEVYWQSSKTVVAAGLTNLVVLDPDIVQAEAGYDTIKFTGVERGETVILGYLNGKPVSMRVRVVQRPLVVVPPALLQRQAEMAHGSLSTNVETARIGGVSSVAFLNGMSWSQLMGSDGHFDFSGQFEDNSISAGHNFNVRTASATYYDPHLEVRAIDFNANLVGSGSQPSLASYSFSDFVALRGASVTLNRGDNHYDFFGGSTIPYYYLSLGATRDVAGFSFRRKQTADLDIFAATSYINAPLDFLGLDSGRRNNVMQDVGARWRINPELSVQGVAGISNHGGMLRGEFVYSGARMTAYGSAITSSLLNPMNQLGALLTGTSSLRAGWSYRNTDWLTETLSYQHVVTQGFAGITTSGNSDYLSPSVTAKLGDKNDVSLNYTYSHNTGGFASGSATGNRFDAYWHTIFTRHVSNSTQFSVGSFQDPLQLSSEDQYLFSDTLSMPVKGGNLFVAVEHDRTNPSLVSKLHNELSLLSPELQNLFLSDPVSFVNSPNLPPEIRALLNAQNPVGTSVSVAGQFHLGNRLNFGPSFSLARSTNGTTESWAPYLGYGLAYRLNSSMLLTSALTNQWVLVNTTGVAQHTSIFSFGFTKTFTASPEIFLAPLHHPRVIEGRIFRDIGVKGFFKAGDTGMAGLQVRLDTGESTTTDAAGRYKFSGVSSGTHEVTLDVTQFGQPVRMTTKANIGVDLVRSNLAVVNFGVVDFARLLGSVFNDLRFEGKRQPDSKDMPEVRLILDDGKTKRTLASEGGEFEVEDLSPGDYTVQVDPDSVPPNYTVPQDSFPVHISPVSSVRLDIPVQALRSISGRVYLQGPSTGKDSKPVLVPLEGVRLSADGATAVSDKDGNFVLRHLPAGELTITVVPVRPVPPGMKVPSGPVHMPAEPIEVTGATIVISNQEMVPYLVGKTAQEVRSAALIPGR
jgi:hypothetical protein